MKTALILCTLAVLAISQASVVKQARANLILGSVQPGDRLLRTAQLYQPAIANRIQTQDLIFRGNATTRITSIQAREVGATQYAQMRLISGGLNRNNATLRATSRQSYGFNYQIQIYGR
ncbi:transcription activator MBF2 domain-containing protein [Phthorimaea operculella]|nr:transcription activator MBF2 domain-containing protein [Phthorimaea operculella]